jgi:hypothetical protein
MPTIAHGKADLAINGTKTFVPFPPPNPNQAIITIGKVTKGSSTNVTSPLPHTVGQVGMYTIC